MYSFSKQKWTLTAYSILDRAVQFIFVFHFPCFEKAIDVVQYLHEKTNCDITSSDNLCARYAAGYGHLKVLKYIHQQTNCSLASTGIHDLQILQKPVLHSKQNKQNSHT